MDAYNDSTGGSADGALENDTTSVYYNHEDYTFLPLTGIRPITPTYLQIAQEEPTAQTGGSHHKILVILDLNGTLLYRSDNARRTISPRPFLREFLDFLFDNFRVMVWSSARESSVRTMLGTCFLDKLTKLDRIWSREHFQLDTVDFHRKVLTLKDLEFVWREIEAEREQAPEEELQPGQRYGTQYDQTNTVLIDDSPHKSQLQPYNCVLIRDFNKKLSLESTDIELVKVMKYLQRLIGQQNVSAYIRRHPFDTTSEEFQSKSFLKGIRSLGDVRKRLKRKLRKDRRKEKAPPRVVLVESPEVLEARLKRKRLKHRKKKENRQGRLEAPQKEQREERVKTKMKVRVNAKKAKVNADAAQ